MRVCVLRAYICMRVCVLRVCATGGGQDASKGARQEGCEGEGGAGESRRDAPTAGQEAKASTS